MRGGSQKTLPPRTWSLMEPLSDGCRQYQPEENWECEMLVRRSLGGLLCNCGPATCKPLKGDPRNPLLLTEPYDARPVFRRYSLPSAHLTGCFIPATDFGCEFSNRLPLINQGRN